VTDEPLSHETPQPSATLDLTRRKDSRPPAPPRRSIARGGRAAGPYVTMARIAIGQLARSRFARVGVAVLAAIVFFAVFADLLAGSPTQVSVDVLLPPLTRGHLLGTDAVGRDLFSRVVHGARTALGLGLAGAMVLVALGVAIGALAGFVGGMLDSIVTRAVEALSAIPTLLLVLVVGATVEHPTAATLIWTIALTRWTELARLMRAEVLLVLGSDYVTAARALGASPSRLLRRHVLPNAVGPAIVAAAFGVASIILAEAAVDFLRVGPPDTMASWGEALGEARGHAGAWWLIVFPGAALLATLLSLNLIGEAARDALDPRLRMESPGSTLKM